MGMQIGFETPSGDACWFSDFDASAEWTFQRRETPHDRALRLRVSTRRSAVDQCSLRELQRGREGRHAGA